MLRVCGSPFFKSTKSGGRPAGSSANPRFGTLCGYALYRLCCMRRQRFGLLSRRRRLGPRGAGGVFRGFAIVLRQVVVADVEMFIGARRPYGTSSDVPSLGDQRVEGTQRVVGPACRLHGTSSDAPSVGDQYAAGNERVVGLARHCTGHLPTSQVQRFDLTPRCLVRVGHFGSLHL